MEIIRKGRIWIKLFSILLAIAAGTACLIWRWGHDYSLTGNIAQAAQVQQLKLVLKTESVDYQGESLIKAVVQMDTEHAGIQAYSIYLDYDQDLLKPIAIYEETEQYNQSYYQYEGLAMVPMVNYTQGNVNAQYASVNHTVDQAGSLLFIAYFQVIATGEGSAEIWITEESTFTGATSDHNNAIIQIGKDSILKASVRLGDQIKNANTSESIIYEEKNTNDNYNHENSIEDSNPSNIQNTTVSQETGNNVELTQDKNHFVEDQTDQQENNTSENIKNEDDRENSSTSAILKKKKLKLNKSKAMIRVGKTLNLKVKNTTKKIKWSSSRKKVASVNKLGKVKARKPGTAVIRAKMKGGKIFKCKVTVK